MKFAYPTIDEVFDTENGMYNSVIIENKNLFSEIITDLYNQKNGNTGKAVVSEDYMPVSVVKKVEIIDRFIPFEMNTKAILNAITSALEKSALSEENIGRSFEITAEVERFLTDIAFEFPCDISFSGVSVPSIIKHSGIAVESGFDNISEKVCEYMNLVTEFVGKKMFITLNMRSFINDDEMENFIKTVLTHGYNIIAFENCAYKKLKNEKRFIIDEDLCEISC